MVVVVCLGVGLRLWVLGRAPVTSDEAVVGLMAANILHGHFTAFYWGQSYGGVEPDVTALVFLLFGQSSFTLELTPVLMNLAAAVVVWRLGRRLFSPAVGMAAGALFMVWPLVDVWNATVSGFRETALLLGLVVLLFAQRIADSEVTDRRGRPLDWAVLGLAVGLGWWATPEIAYFVVPAACVVALALVRRRIRLSLTGVAAFVPAAVLGDLPWLWSNFGDHFASLHTPKVPGQSFSLHLHVFVSHALPISMGLQAPLSGHWVFGHLASHVLEGLVLLAWAWWALVLLRRGQALILVLYAAAYPVLYAFGPLSSDWQDGRYVVFLGPALALLSASGADAGARWLANRRRAGRRSARGPAVVAMALAVVLASCLTLDVARRFSPYAPGPEGPLATDSWTSWHTDPSAGYDALAASVERQGLHDLVAGYWMAYVLDFESHGTLVATDFLSDRYPPYAAAVLEAPHAGWLFYLPAGQTPSEVAPALLEPGCISGYPCIFPAELESWLETQGVGYQVKRLGSFVLVVPSQPIDIVKVYNTYAVPTVPVS